MVQNVTGWSELIEGKPIQAVYAMYDLAWNHWFVVILFVVFQFMLFLKTKNLTLMWVTGLFFGSLYIISNYFPLFSRQIIFAMLVFELAGILFMWLMKR